MKEYIQIQGMKTDAARPDLWSNRHVRVVEVEEAVDVQRALCLSPQQEDAFYLCNLDAVVDKYLLWKIHFPRVKPFYAVKCNSSELVLKTLAALGAGFDCASLSEFEKVLALGVDPSRIIYAHTAKQASHLRHAAAEGVKLTTFDNEDELKKIKELHPECRLLLRIRCDSKKALQILGQKYGCVPETEEVPRLLSVAKSLGLHVVGVCFHVGSGCQDAPVFRKAIRLARDVFRMGEDLGFLMNILDIGGGFPGRDDDHFTKMAHIVNAAIDEYFSDALDLTIISEPGRFFMEAAMTLAVNVHSRRILRDEEGGVAEVMYFVNAGLHTGFINYPRWEQQGKPLVKTEKSSILLPSSVWGPTCDGGDMIEGPLQMPLLDVGSWLIYQHMGAYSACLSNKFNGFPIPKTHTVASRQTRLLLAEHRLF